jgi:pyruvate dehydrogenase E2 component (dihydrolipoamide acetyltransferase)
VPETQLLLDADLIGDEEEAEIVAWIADDGAEVALDEELVEVSTAKAIVVAAAPAAGRLTHHVAVGETVANGTALCTIAH